MAIALGVREGYTAEAVARGIVALRGPALGVRTSRRLLQIHRAWSATAPASLEAPSVEALARMRRLRDKLGRAHYSARAVRFGRARVSGLVGAGTAILMGYDGSGGPPRPFSGKGLSPELVDLLLAESALRSRVNGPARGPVGAGALALLSTSPRLTRRTVTLLSRPRTTLTNPKIEI